MPLLKQDIATFTWREGLSISLQIVAVGLSLCWRGHTVLRIHSGRIRFEPVELIEPHRLLHFSLWPVSLGTCMHALSGRTVTNLLPGNATTYKKRKTYWGHGLIPGPRKKSVFIIQPANATLLNHKFENKWDPKPIYFLFYFYLFYFTVFFWFGYATWFVGSQFPDQGLNPCPLQWKRRVLTTRSPGNSPKPI